MKLTAPSSYERLAGLAESLLREDRTRRKVPFRSHVFEFLISFGGASMVFAAVRNLQMSPSTEDSKYSVTALYILFSLLILAVFVKTFRDGDD